MLSPLDTWCEVASNEMVAVLQEKQLLLLPRCRTHTYLISEEGVHSMLLFSLHTDTEQ